MMDEPAAGAFRGWLRSIIVRVLGTANQIIRGAVQINGYFV